MTEDKVWEQATKIWEKKEEVGIGLDSILVNRQSIKISYYIDSGYEIVDKWETFETTTQVRRFLDGLEKP